MDSDSDDGAGAANTMDLTRIKSQMPKKVFKSEHIDTCDPAVLLNAQLFESIGVDDNDSVLLWLKHGAPINSRNDVHGNGATPLIEATTRKNKWLINHLVSLGADATLADNMGRTPLHVAVRLQNVELATAILESKELDIDAAMVGTLNTPLHIAAYDGHVPLCKLLLAHGADVNCANANGETALHLATKRHHDEAATLLIDSGADVMARTKNTAHLPLHLACQNGSMCVAAQLVDRGVSMHEREAAGRSALDLARAYGHYNLATQLLHTEASRRERQEKDRVKAVKTKIAADIAAQKAQEKYERFLRREAARKQREEDERREAARIRAEADAVKKAADDARDAATRRIKRVAREARVKREKREAKAAKIKAAAEAKEAERVAAQKAERQAYRDRIHAAASRRVKRAAAKKPAPQESEDDRRRRKDPYAGVDEFASKYF